MNNIVKIQFLYSYICIQYELILSVLRTNIGIELMLNPASFSQNSHRLERSRKDSLMLTEQSRAQEGEQSRDHPGKPSSMYRNLVVKRLLA